MGRRIITPYTLEGMKGTGTTGAPDMRVDGYFDKVIKSIPGDIVAGWTAILGLFGATPGLVAGVTISSTGFIDPNGVAFESASSMFLLDSEQGDGGSVYRVDLGTGEATALATSDGGRRFWPANGLSDALAGLGAAFHAFAGAGRWPRPVAP